jgi:hypothetical protein
MKKYLLLFSLLFIQQKDLQAQYVFNWAKSSSGTGAEVVSNLCSDANNNIYLSIYFNSSSIDIDMGPGTVNLTSAAAGNDGVIAKYDQNGNYQWAVHFNSSINSQVTNAVVD